MKKFTINSMRRRDSEKWYPAGIITTDNKYQSLDEPISFTDNLFDSKKEADNFFRAYCLKQGYKEI